MTKHYLLISFLSLALLGGTKASAQGKSDDPMHTAYCDCIAKYSYTAHYDEYNNSEYKCYRAWKKDMKRKKKECQAKALETSRPLSAERKRKRAEMKAWKRDQMETAHKGDGERHDYWN